MEIKKKENVNVSSFTFKKRVIEEALELLGRKKNYMLNDLKFITMITFTNNLVENNLVIESLYNVDDIENKMADIVEPLFKEEVLEKPEALESFNEIVSELEEYMEREVEMRLTISGFLYDFVEDLGGLSMEDIVKLINQALDKIGGLKTKKPDDIEIKSEALKEIEKAKKRVEDAKMKALIDKYTKQEGAESNKEKDATE